jgi:hydrogenase nickel incorporation protein HypA/HybF
MQDSSTRQLCGIMADMHELAVTQSVLDIAVRHAGQAGARRILAVNLVIGDLTGFVDDSIQFYFDFLSKDTIAQSAQLNIERIAARVQCHVCGAEYAPPDSRLWTCPDCRALGGDVIGGKEFSVASIEIE